MLIYILKFSACLSIFMVFYKLFLEKSSIHNFKRFYLLGSVILAIGIPLITFVEFVEPIITQPEVFTSLEFESNTVTTEQISIDYTTIILWSIYSLGAFIFLLKFSLNLFQIIKRIQKNPKFKTENYINVLIKNLMTTHTFFNYIFLNKSKFENNEIPKEILIHEQTHANQKHSIDIIILELLKIVFWFNPLLYLLKRDIKLNHEFLADRAVLKNGIQRSEYQQLLLAFSSNVSEPQLANAINYSSIKKRFTVMKTKTSKTSVWFKSLLLVPLIAFTLYGFSETKEVFKEASSEVLLISDKDSNAEKEAYYQNAIFKFKDVNGKVIASKRYSELTQEEKDRLFLPIVHSKKESPSLSDLNRWKDSKNYGVWYDGKKVDNNILTTISPSSISSFTESKLEKNAVNYGEYFNQVNLHSNIYLKERHKNDAEYSSKQFVVTINKSDSKTATKSQIEEYNKLAKEYNAQPKDKRVVKKADLKRLEFLYNEMNDSQKKAALPFPECPPTPPLPPKVIDGHKVKTGFLKINGTPHYYVDLKNQTKFYNREGFEVSKTGRIISASQINASDVIPGQYITKVYSDNKVVAEFKNNKPSLKGELNIPSPKLEKTVKGEKAVKAPKKPKPPKSPKSPKAPKAEKSKKDKKKSKTPKSPKTPKTPKTPKIKKLKEVPAPNKGNDKSINLSGLPMVIESQNLNKHDKIKSSLDHSKSKLTFVTDMTQDNTLRFCYNGKTITKDRAIRITKNNPKVHIRLGIEHKTGQNIIYLSKNKPLIGYKG